MSEITIDELEIIKHSLGLNYKKEPFRNYFSTNEKGKDFDTCESLVSKGLMIKRVDPFGNGFVYQISELGKKEVLK